MGRRGGGRRSRFFFLPRPTVEDLLADSPLPGPLQAAQDGRVRRAHSAVALGQGGLPVGGRDHAQGGVALGPGGGTASGPGRAVLTTPRLVLRPFEDADRQPFSDLNAHPLVVASLGVEATRAESDAMIDRYTAELARARDGASGPSPSGAARALIGMVGLHRVPPELPCAPAVEVGWRLHPDHWGQGYATEAARASLDARLRGGRRRDRRLHHDIEHPLSGRHGAHRHGARPGRRLRPPLGSPKAARCGNTCCTASAHRSIGRPTVGVSGRQVQGWWMT